MRSMDGMVTIVQESRFQLVDADGVAHHFVLARNAAADPEQLPSLLMRRVQVGFTAAGGIIGHQAHRIIMLDDR